MRVRPKRLMPTIGQDPSLFEQPEGYNKKQMEQMQKNMPKAPAAPAAP